MAAPPVTQLEMVQAFLEAGHPAEVYDEMEFVYAIFELEGHLPPEEMLSFLEKMAQLRPDVFQAEAAWYLRIMVPLYLTAGRREDIATVLKPLLQDPLEDADATFDLLDTIRLAGQDAEARGLAEAMYAHTGDSDLMPYAIDEIGDIAGMFLIEAFSAGCGPQDLGALQAGLTRYGWQIEEERLSRVLAHYAGTAGVAWTEADFAPWTDDARDRFLLLLFDFGRWLVSARGIAPVCAGALRSFVTNYFYETIKTADRNPLALHAARLDRYLAGMLSWTSMMRTRGLGAAIGLAHFYDFLPEVDLATAKARETALADIGRLWKQARALLRSDWWRFEYLTPLHPLAESK